MLFKKKKVTNPQGQGLALNPNSAPHNESMNDYAVKHKKNNWYEDRYLNILIQRNIFAYFSLLLLVSVVIIVIYAQKVLISRSVEPFVVEVEKSTGIPTMVSKASTHKYTSTQVMQEYFINKYIISRESFLPDIYAYNYRQVVRLLSAEPIYKSFFRTTYGVNGPVRTLANSNNKILVIIKSLQYLEDNVVQIRIVKKHVTNQGALSREEHKIVALKFEFANLNLTYFERNINPLGFRVTFYQMNDDLVLRK